MAKRRDQQTSQRNQKSARLFDTHCHFDEQDDPKQLVSAAADAGVACFTVVGSDAESSRRSLQLAKQIDGCYATAGIHPHDADQFNGDLTPFRELLQAPEMVAVGETGLDYFYDNAPRQHQRQSMTAFLELARELGKPAVIHCRDAYEDCLQIVRDNLEPASFVIHCFSGDPGWIERFGELGAYFSFNGLVTFKKAENIREALRCVPSDRLLLETDSPYLAPEPYRGHRNQPAYIPEIAQRVAQELELERNELAELTTANAFRFFNLSPG